MPSGIEDGQVSSQYRKNLELWKHCWFLLSSLFAACHCGDQTKNSIVLSFNVYQEFIFTQLVLFNIDVKTQCAVQCNSRGGACMLCLSITCKNWRFNIPYPYKRWGSHCVLVGIGMAGIDEGVVQVRADDEDEFTEGGLTWHSQTPTVWYKPFQPFFMVHIHHKQMQLKH